MESFLRPDMGPISFIPTSKNFPLYLGNIVNALAICERGNKEKWAILNCTDDDTLDEHIGPMFDIIRLNHHDGKPYSFDQITEGLTFIRSNLYLGNKVLVCCHAGVSRSPGMILAYLLSERLSYNQAVARIRKSRNIIQIHPQIDLSVRKYFDLAPRSAADLIP